MMEENEDCICCDFLKDKEKVCPECGFQICLGCMFRLTIEPIERPQETEYLKTLHDCPACGNIKFPHVPTDIFTKAQLREWYCDLSVSDRIKCKSFIQFHPTMETLPYQISKLPYLKWNLWGDRKEDYEGLFEDFDSTPTKFIEPEF